MVSFGLVKGLFRGAGRAIWVWFTSLFWYRKKICIVSVSSLIAFLNSDTFERMKVISSENLLPLLTKLRDNVFIPSRIFN